MRVTSGPSATSAPAAPIRRLTRAAPAWQRGDAVRGLGGAAQRPRFGEVDREDVDLVQQGAHRVEVVRGGGVGGDLPEQRQPAARA